MATIADIAWPGPRPLSFEADGDGQPARTLIGRERELRELLHLCQSFAVIEITAASGVGKTSFVAASVPHLEEGGARVVKARPWVDTLGELGDGEPDDPVPLYCLALGRPPCRDGSELTKMLRDLGDGQPVVCIFDQLEELLRFQDTLGERLLELIGRTAAASGVPHMLVARSESRDELRPVEVRGAPTWHMLLGELVEPEVIRRVVEEPVPEDVVLERGVVELLLEWWEAGRKGTSPEEAPAWMFREPLFKCGLLHFQALLWSLQRWATKSLAVEPQLLTVANLGEYTGERRISAGPDWGAVLMADALRNYVDDAVDACRPAIWPNGHRVMFARSAGHLSSAGFKVPQSGAALISRAMQEELGSSKSRHDLHGVELGPKSSRHRAELFAGRFQIEGAGVAAGLDSWRVAKEMMSCLEGVLRTLSDRQGPNILRRFNHGGDSVYELVHDGIAPALDRWADEVLEEPVVTVGGITARRGEVFNRELTPETFLDRNGKPGPHWSAVEPAQVEGRTRVVISGIQWLGLGVHHPDPADSRTPPQSVLMEDLVFRDCVFVGTLFKNVVFRNVSFEACNLQGVAMIGCTFENVRFAGCRLVGAAMNVCSFRGVRFDCKGVEGSMNYVSIERSQPEAEVEIRNLEKTNGLFLVKLEGGRWSLEDVRLAHFSFESDKRHEVRLKLAGKSRLSHATLAAPPGRTSVEVGPKVQFGSLTAPDGIIPRDVLERVSGNRG